MKDSELRTRVKSLALHIIAVCDEIDTRKGRGVLVNQIVRSATSIGANIHEATYAESGEDFIHKLRIALKECHETEYWLNVLNECLPQLSEETHMLRKDAGAIRYMLISSINTRLNSLGKAQLYKKN